MSDPVAVHNPAVQRERPACLAQPDMRHECGYGTHRSSGLRSSEVGSPSSAHSFFLGIDDQLRVLELAAQTGVLAIELLDLPGRRIRLRPPSLWGQRHAIGRIHLLAPAREHRGINALAAQKRAEGAGLLATVGLGEQRALLAGRELAAPGGRDNLRVGCRRGPGHPFTRPTGSLRDAQGRSRGSAVHRRVHYCCHLWILPLDTKLPKAVVPPHLGTRGARKRSTQGLPTRLSTASRSSPFLTRSPGMTKTAV